MRIFLVTIGLAVLLCCVGGAAYCITTLYEGTPECAAAAQTQEALDAAQKQFDTARNTPAAPQLGERMETLAIQARVSRSNCEESAFRYKAYAAASGIGILFGALILAVGRILHRNRHFGLGWGQP